MKSFFLPFDWKNLLDLLQRSKQSPHPFAALATGARWHLQNLFTSRTRIRDKCDRSEWNTSKTCRRRLSWLTNIRVVIFGLLCVDRTISICGEAERRRRKKHSAWYLTFLQSWRANGWRKKTGMGIDFVVMYSKRIRAPRTTPNECHFFAFFYAHFFLFRSLFKSIFISINTKAIFQLAWTWW